MSSKAHPAVVRKLRVRYDRVGHRAGAAFAAEALRARRRRQQERLGGAEPLRRRRRVLLLGGAPLRTRAPAAVPVGASAFKRRLAVGRRARGELYAVHASVAHDIRERAFVARLAPTRVRAGIAHRPRAADGGRFRRLRRRARDGVVHAHRNETQGFPRGFRVEFRRGRERPGDARVRAGGRPERRRLHHAHAPEEARRRATRAR